MAPPWAREGARAARRSPGWAGRALACACALALGASAAQAAPQARRRPSVEDPDGIEARLAFRACAAARREERAAVCRAALSLGPGRERAALAQLLLARALASRERWDEALEAHREVLRLQPDDPDAARRVGQVLLHGLDRPADAELYLRQALGARADAATHVDLGWALNALGRHEEAVGEFRAALDLDPDVLAERPAAQAAYAASQRAAAWP